MRTSMDFYSSATTSMPPADLVGSALCPPMRGLMPLSLGTGLGLFRPHGMIMILVKMMVEPVSIKNH